MSGSIKNWLSGRIPFLFLLLLFHPVAAQTDWFKITGLSEKKNQSEKPISDSLVKKFNSDNWKRINDIAWSLSRLPIDQCHYHRIQVYLAIDSSGTAFDLMVVKGSGYEKTDLKIRMAILNYPGSWITPVVNDTSIFVEGLFSFDLTRLSANKYYDPKTVRIAYGTGGVFISETSKNCEDSEFYYNQATKKFANADYKSAVTLFNKAVQQNCYDVDAIYNLAVSYLRINKIETACKWFHTGDDYGDPAAAAAVQKHCENIPQE